MEDADAIVLVAGERSQGRRIAEVRAIIEEFEDLLVAASAFEPYLPGRPRPHLAKQLSANLLGRESWSKAQSDWSKDARSILVCRDRWTVLAVRCCGRRWEKQPCVHSEPSRPLRAPVSDIRARLARSQKLPFVRRAVIGRIKWTANRSLLVADAVFTTVRLAVAWPPLRARLALLEMPLAHP